LGKSAVFPAKFPKSEQFVVFLHNSAEILKLKSGEFRPICHFSTQFSGNHPIFGKFAVLPAKFCETQPVLRKFPTQFRGNPPIFGKFAVFPARFHETRSFSANLYIF